jgi:hypothetical protein
MKCPLCGHENPAGSFFCAVCASPMGWGEGQPPEVQAPVPPQQPPGGPQYQPGQAPAQGGQPQYGQGQAPVPGGYPQYAQPTSGQPPEQVASSGPIPATEPYQSPGEVARVEYAPTVPTAARPSSRVRPADATLADYWDAYGAFIAIVLGGFVLLRLTAEMLVRFYPGRSFLGGDGVKLVASRLPGPLGVLFGSIMVLVIAVAAGWLIGKFYKERPVLFGALAGLAITGVEFFYSICRIGAIARLMGYAHGTPSVNWPYTVMLGIILVGGAGFAAWGSSGFGMERVGTAGLKRTVLIVGGTAVGLLVLMTAVGGLIRVTRSYTNSVIEVSYRWLDNLDSWGAQFVAFERPDQNNGAGVASIQFVYLGSYQVQLRDLKTEKITTHVVTYDGAAYSVTGDAEPVAEKRNLGVELFDSTTRPKYMKVKDQWAGTWNGKACTVVEVSGDVRDVPILNNIVGLLPWKPSLTGGGTTYEAYIWIDVGSPKIFLVSYQLYAPGGGLGSGGRLDLQFTWRPTQPGN